MSFLKLDVLWHL